MPEIPQRLLGDALVRSARLYPDKVAIINRGREYTYQEFHRQAGALAHLLSRNGVERGDRVAIFMHNSYEAAVAIYGASLAGAVFLAINIQTKPGKLNYILNDCGAVALISESLVADEIFTAIGGVPTLELMILKGENQNPKPLPEIRSFRFEEIVNDHGLPDNLPQTIPTDLAALIYTSGSTGFPKGVMMTHQSMVFTTWSLIEYLRLESTDRIMLLLPLAFDYGLYQLIMSVTLGGTLIIEYSFTFQASVYRSIEQFKPTVFPGVPTIYAMMIASYKERGIQFPGIQKVTNTAAALPVEFMPDLKKIFPNALVFPMYGLTECKRVCYLEPELVDEKPGSVGKAIPGTEVFLLSQDGNPVPAGQPGILHVRGPHVMLGYWKQDELSRKMLKPGNLPGERILCSNDWFIKDEEGFLYFQGRNDDMIKSRGEKVCPMEIENVIYSVKGVREAAVTGVPDPVMGEMVVAFVTLYPGVEISEKEILKTCTNQLELFMVPSVIHIVTEMPKSSNGKIDKKELKQRFFPNKE